MSITIEYVVLLLLVIALLISIPVFLLVAGFKQHKKSQSLGAKMMIGGGIAFSLLSLFTVATHLIEVGPYRSGVVAHDTSPQGHEYAVVQTYKDFGLLGEPYQVSFYMRDADGAWRWHYLDHQSNAWRDVKVTFLKDNVEVSNRGHLVQALQVPTGSINRATLREGDDYLPAEYIIDDVLNWHNAKFK